jgi:ABC-2 type transport system permease protein
VSAAYAVEALKLRRSRVVGVATAALLLGPTLLARGFLAAAQGAGADPMSAKAGALVRGDGWVGYLDGLTQVYATGGLLGVGIVVGWCFGREFSDRTVVSLYASATPRAAVARAKLVLLGVWSLLVSLALVGSTVAVGVATGLGPPDGEALSGLARLAVLAALTGLLALPVALAASAGRGYLAAFGGLLGLIVAAQAAVVAGVGGWWPWSVAALWAIDPTPGSASVSPARLLLVPLVAVGAAALTSTWWRRAEVA